MRCRVEGLGIGLLSGLGLGLGLLFRVEGLRLLLGLA